MTKEQAPDAVQVIVQALEARNTFEFDDLLQRADVQALKNDKKNTKLYKYLETFAKGDLAAFETLNKEDSKYLSTVGINYEAAHQKMRLLALATLGSEGVEVPYSTIATALRIDEADVEKWIIQAISLKILGAKIDQLRRVVRISSRRHLVLDDVQWDKLRDRLSQWRDNLQNMIQVIETAKTEPDQAE
eukprot:TRINITY_DN7974_c0_g1::TRINITY_DN7974_c0_g1_i1::g.15561::m.15561 TRINITY_DN7974_c0_g1::TRINITY_DN7974_c0_g1_i1::g.15561  ORF type:complete len:189 (+),score=61.03,sp/Q54KZ8/EIF3M_DICDI/38.25/1e-35,PCI/PF01399.22/4.7e+03,PCI/PF01399.22/3.2e-11,PCI/PF01399.22/1.2e+04,DUF2497/PF10691.4/0.067 TRINITY_DN7974_c0_g1_i1:31-597(+)